MRKWLAIIIDDQGSSIAHLERLLRPLEYIQVVATFQQHQEALTYLRVNPVDFIILDVELGSINGFDFLSLLPNPQIPTILYTAHQHYEDRGYERCLVDVLLKPVSQQRLLGALRRVDEQLRKRIVLKDDDDLGHWYDYFQIKGPYRFERKIVWFKDICYVESKGKMVFIYLVGEKEPLVCNKSLKYVDGVLPKKWFKQCHQSFVVNINFFKKYANNKVYLKHVSDSLPVGSSLLYTDFFAFLEIEV